LSENNKSGSRGQVVEFSKATGKAASRNEAKREAKAKEIRNRFSAARKASASKSKAAERLKKVFTKPPKPPSNPR